VEFRHVETLKRVGMLARQVSIAGMFADDRSVLALHQHVVGAAVGA
jgi:hypothetical protein